MSTRQRIPDPEVEPWISIPEAGAIFGLSRAAAYQAAARGDIPTVQVGKRFFVPTAKLRALLGLATDPASIAELPDGAEQQQETPCSQ